MHFTAAPQSEGLGPRAGLRGGFLALEKWFPSFLPPSLPSFLDSFMRHCSCTIKSSHLKRTNSVGFVRVMKTSSASKSRTFSSPQKESPHQ